MWALERPGLTMVRVLVAVLSLWVVTTLVGATALSALHVALTNRQLGVNYAGQVWGDPVIAYKDTVVITVVPGKPGTNVQWEHFSWPGWGFGALAIDKAAPNAMGPEIMWWKRTKDPIGPAISIYAVPLGSSSGPVDLYPQFSVGTSLLLGMKAFIAGWLQSFWRWAIILFLEIANILVWMLADRVRQPRHGRVIVMLV